jgi:hypothetical protein
MPLRKKVGYVGLKDLQYTLQDTDAISRDYFNIIEFPDRFTAGKNLFKLKAQAGNLVDQSEIYIEILDFNGNPIYYEPINYIEKDGTRVIAVYIYPDTSPGIATVYLASRAAINTATGATISYSRDVNATNYYNTPNLLWKRTVTVAPKARNSTEIIFTQYPRITLSEVIQPYQQPLDIYNVITTVSASGASLTITPLPLTPYGPAQLSSFTQGAGTSGTPNYGLQFFDIGTINDSLNTSNNTSADAPPLYTLNGASKLTTVGFPLNANMVGGYIEIRNPNIKPISSGPNQTFGFSSTANGYVPESQADEADIQYPAQNFSLPLSGSYRFAITQVINSTQARVAQYYGFRNDDDNTYGPFAVRVAHFDNDTLNTPPLVTSIQSTTNFTASYTQPVVTIQTQRSSSFADMILANIEPATGDVYKIKTLYKPSGFFGDFIDLGDTILEQQNLLIDTGSIETNIAIGVAYEAFGAFDNLAEVEQYWTTSSYFPGNPGVESWLPFTYDDTILIGGAKLNLDYGNLGTGVGPQLYLITDQYASFSIKPVYQPIVYADTEYIVRFNIANDSDADNIFSQDANIPNHRMDVYISGSRVETQDQFRFAQAGNIFSVPNFGNTVVGDFRDNGPLGTRIGTYQVKPIPGAISQVEFRFKAKDTGPIDLKFVTRNGHFIIGNIEFLANKETGFSPNYTRIFKRVPSEHFNTPLTFKFQYFDYTGQQADLESIVYGAIFDGDNTYIQGTNNLITGSIFISDEIGTGLELAGTNSGYLRSAGFLGMTKAIAGTGSAAGILFYSGSILRSQTSEFAGGGVGFQIAASTDKYMRINSNTDDFTIKTPGFTFASRKGDETAASITGSLEVSGGIILDGYARFNPVTTNINTSISASYIYVSGSTNDLYFSQNGSGYNNVTRLRWLEGNLYTGLLHGGIISQLTTTTYQVASGSGIIVNLNTSIGSDPYPVVQFLTWSNLSASIAPLTASYDQQFVAINSSNQIFAQGIPYTNGDYNDKIPIGIVLHQNRSTINGVQTFPGVAYGWKQRSFDFIKAFGGLKISGYALSQSGSSAGGLLLSGGTSWVDGRNYTIDPTMPSYIVEAVGTPTSKIFRYYQSGSNWQSNWGYDTNGGAGYTAIDPTQYSNAGTLTPVSTNNFTIQRVFYFPNSATKALFVYYGNAQYANEEDALAAVNTETFAESPNTAASAIYIGFMLLRHNADFNTPASYTFYSAGLFRGAGGGGGSGGGGGGATALTGLMDVNISSPTDGQPLVYNTAATKWINSSAITASLYGTATSASYAATASYSKTLGAGLGNDASGLLKLINSDNTTISSITALTSSLALTAYTASYVDDLNQTVTIGNITSKPSSESTLNVYPPIVPGTGEGGQIMLAASGGLYTSASMLDTYQNYFRILKGTNTLGSNAQLIGLDLHTGNLSVAGAVNPSTWTAGQVIKDTMLSNTDVTISTTTVATSTSDTDFLTYSYTPISSTSYLVIHYHLANYDFSGGTGNDSYISRIKVDGSEITYSTQSTVNGNRSGVLFPLTGRYTNSSTAAKSIVVACRRNSADDSITITDSATSMWLRITEIAR